MYAFRWEERSGKTGYSPAGRDVTSKVRLVAPKSFRYTKLFLVYYTTWNSARGNPPISAAYLNSALVFASGELGGPAS